MADADVFGIPGEDSSNDDWLKAGIEGDPSAPTTEGTTEAPAAPEVPVPGAPAGQQPVAGAEPQPTAEGQRLWANKFQSPEELEKAYRSATGEMHRARTRSREVEGQFAEITERNRVLEDTLQRALPFLQRMSQPPAPQQAPGYPAQQSEYGAEPQPPVQFGPDQLMPYIDQVVTQRTNAIRQELAQQMQQEEAVAVANDAIEGFFENHPEVDVYGEADNAIAQTIGRLNESWGSSGKWVDVTDSDVLERVYESSKREALQEVLLNNPRYIDTESGMTLARFEASLLEGGAPITQGTAQVPASMVGQRPPVVERASTGPAPEGTQPADEFEEAVLNRRRAMSGTFGGSVF